MFSDYGVIVMYNTIQKRWLAMRLKMRRSVMGKADDRVLIYSALFLVCALLSAAGAGVLGLLSLLPAIAVVELIAQWGGRRSDRPRQQV